MNIHVCDGKLDGAGVVIKDHDKLTAAEFVVVTSEAGEYGSSPKHLCREHFRTWLQYMSTGGSRSGYEYKFTQI